ncbi:hypothetical protein FA95DRAFT_1043795 [Auriscalpium vulgare]|uniref:Uncharacterized protein n=1 Tax=Auriscalpium vulgare TaxID=40419 RepID=A0ACB8R6H3_9AGAM|nr:hypothetical protein FA95DRAFT_1043795 [Auriscalpium vulgare]
MAMSSAEETTPCTKTIWLDAMTTRLAELGDVPQRSPSPIYTSAESLHKAEHSIRSLLSDCNARSRSEIWAIDVASRAIFRRFEDEADVLRNTLRELAEQHNRWTPVMRLPPEVFATIFMFLAIADPPRREYIYEPLELGWMAVTHVCRRWRYTALEFPSLWTDLNFSLGSSCLKAMLSRSKFVPDLHFSVPPDSGAAAYHLIAENLHRTKSVCCSMGGYEAYRVQTPVGPAPLLEALDLQLTDSYKYSPSTALYSSSRSSIPLELIGASAAPNLHHLRLRSTLPLPWASPLLTNLVSLVLQQDHESPLPLEFVPSLGEILNALRKMKRLQNLVLDVIFQEPSSSFTSEKVNLPGLKHLAASAAVTAARHLLQYLSIPSTATVHLDLATPSTGHLQDVVSFFSTLSSLLCLEQSQALRSLSYQLIGHKKKKKFRVYAWDLEDGRDAPQVYVAFSPEENEELADELAVAALAPSISKHIAELGLKHINMNPENFENSLRSATRLLSLTIYKAATLELFFDLPWSAPSEAVTNHFDDFPSLRGPMLPALKVLTIRGVNLAERRTALPDAAFDDSMTPNPADRPYDERLAQWLSDRRTAGYLLAKLDLLSSTIGEECLELLEEDMPQGSELFADAMVDTSFLPCDV